MRTTLLCLALLVAATAAWAVRPDIALVGERMTGSVQVADPSLVAGWFSNPAALADLLPAADGADGLMVNEFGAAYEFKGDQDAKCLSWGGRMPDSALGLGLGAGWMEGHDGRIYGLGAGVRLPVRVPLAVGVSAGSARPHWASDSEIVFDAGVRGTIPMEEIEKIEVSYGVVLRDVTDQFARTWDAGLSVRCREMFTFGVDLVDVLDDDEGREWRWGVKADLPTEIPCTLGFGRNDDNWTAGFEVGLGALQGLKGADVRLGVAWEEHSGDDSWIAGARAGVGL